MTQASILIVEDDEGKKLRETQAALTASEARYRKRFDHSPLGTFESTVDGTFLSLNAAMVRMLGYESAEEALGLVTDLGTQLYLDPAQRTLFLDALNEHGFVRDFEFQAKRKNGEIIWL